MIRALMLSAAALIALPAAAQDIAITNAKLVIGDGSAPIEGGTVDVRGGKVVAAGARIAVPAGVETVDAEGRYVTPGIVAAQIGRAHGWTSVPNAHAVCRRLPGKKR